MKIFIINRNRITTTRSLVEYFDGIIDAELRIIDNDSTWKPLLEWYDNDCPIPVTRGEDFGPRSLWAGHSNLIPKNEYYAVTDSDLDLSGCPSDVLDLLVSGLDKYPDVGKVGVSLRLDDLPDEYPLKEFTLKRESEYWEDERDDDFFNADIATTMAVYRPGSPTQYGPALRSKFPYQARHIPWYVTSENITEEEKHYLRNVDLDKWRGIVFSNMAQDHFELEID